MIDTVKFQCLLKKYFGDFIFIIFFLFTLGIYLWRLPYGSGWSDEVFYISMANRFCMGDAAFVDEWNVAQLSGILIYPILKLYYFFTQGQTEGIVIAFRYIYLVFHSAVTIFLYLRLRKKYFLAAIACLFYYLFTPYDLMALSYNTIGIAMVALVGALIITNEKKSRATYIAAGVCYGLAVVCCPYLFIWYIGYTVVRLFCHFVLHKKKETEQWGCFTIGGAVVAFALSVFLLSRAGLGEILSQIPYMFMDEGHAPKSIVSIFTIYFGSIYQSFPIAVPLFLILMTVAFVFKKHADFSVIWFGVSGVVSAITIAFCLTKITDNYHDLLLPVVLLGLLVSIIKPKRTDNLFYWGILFGCVYSFCVNATSDNKSYAIFMGMIWTGVASILIIGDFCNFLIINRKKGYKISLGILIVLFIFQLGSQINVKLKHVFWYSGFDVLTTKITWGPLDGVIERTDLAEKYDSWYDDLNYIKEKEAGEILFLTNETWLQLYVQMPYSYSAWLGIDKDVVLPRMQTFYAVHPEKIPQYIYVPFDSNWITANEVVTKATEIYGYSSIEKENGYVLWRKSVR